MTNQNDTKQNTPAKANPVKQVVEVMRKIDTKSPDAAQERTKRLASVVGPQPFCGTNFKIHNCPQLSLGCPQTCGVHKLWD